VLPWVCLCALIAVLSSIVTVSTYERWWEPASQPGQRRDVDQVTRERRMLGGPDDFGGLHTPNAKVGEKVYRSARVSTRFRLAEPRPADGLLDLGLSLFLLAASAMFSAWLISIVAVTWVRWSGRVRVGFSAALSAAAGMIPVTHVLALFVVLIILAMLSSGSTLATQSLACAFLLGGLAYFLWGTGVMYRIGLSLRIRRPGQGVWLPLVVAAAWLCANMAAFFVFALASDLLFGARY
jgi:hypothetical protein